MFNKTEKERVNSENESPKLSVWQWIGRVIVSLLCLVAVCVCIGGVVYSVLNLEHYNRVYQNPLTVTATVTGHDSYDDEGDTDYISYISYVVNGVEYTHISFEDKDTRSELTAIGQQVEVDVSPEDPAVLLSELESGGRFVVFTLSVLLLMISLGWNLGITAMRSKGNRGTPDRETIQRDVRLTVYGRFSNVFWLLMSVGYLVLPWRYPAAVWDWLYIAGAVCGAIWLWCIYRAVRDLNHMNNDEYELRQDVLVRKEYIPDSEGDTYKLHYKSGDRQWSRNTSWKYYDKVQEGSIVLAVYLPRAKKPIIHYDIDGNAG